MPLKRMTYRSIDVTRGPRGAVFQRGGAVVATARLAPRVWLLRVPGHDWEITPDMPAARFQRIPGGEVMTRTPVKGFPSYQACVREIEKLLGVPTSQ